MNNDKSITLREFLIHSNLKVAPDLQLYWWANSDRDAVCVSFHKKDEAPPYSVNDPTFGWIVHYECGRSIPLSCLDLPLNIDID